MFGDLVPGHTAMKDQSWDLNAGGPLQTLCSCPPAPSCWGTSSVLHYFFNLESLLYFFPLPFSPLPPAAPCGSSFLIISWFFLRVGLSLRERGLQCLADEAVVEIHRLRMCHRSAITWLAQNTHATVIPHTLLWNWATGISAGTPLCLTFPGLHWQTASANACPGIWAGQWLAGQ